VPWRYTGSNATIWGAYNHIRGERWHDNSDRNGACRATPNCDEHVRGLGNDTTLGHWNFNGYGL
jgi:hypothetical protein